MDQCVIISRQAGHRCRRKQGKLVKYACKKFLLFQNHATTDFAEQTKVARTLTSASPEVIIVTNKPHVQIRRVVTTVPASMDLLAMAKRVLMLMSVT